MDLLKLDPGTLRKAWTGADQYWFSLKDYSVRSLTDLGNMDRPDGVSQTQFFVSLGYIPFFNVTNEEVIRAYVSTLSNKKLKEALSNADSSDYVDTFWKYFNVYSEIADGWNDFEDKYVLDKAVAWCNENGIKYSI